MLVAFLFQFTTPRVLMAGDTGETIGEVGSALIEGRDPSDVEEAQLTAEELVALMNEMQTSSQTTAAQASDDSSDGTQDATSQNTENNEEGFINANTFNFNKTDLEKSIEEDFIKIWLDDSYGDGDGDLDVDDLNAFLGKIFVELLTLSGDLLDEEITHKEGLGRLEAIGNKVTMIVYYFKQVIPKIEGVNQKIIDAVQAMHDHILFDIIYGGRPRTPPGSPSGVGVPS